MKKTLVLFMVTVLIAVQLCACNTYTEPETETKTETETVIETEVRKVVELNVVTTFAGDDTNTDNYQTAVNDWEQKTGNVVLDASRRMNGEFLARVVDDFKRGEEPDVLFFFTGADANSFIEENKVVPLSEIRTQYPSYGSNMNDAKLPIAMNGERYVLPVNGVWEGLYVNKAVLAEAGIEVPGMDYTWEQFLQDCGAIKAIGKVPIAATYANVPHYWLEYTIANNSGPENCLNTPITIEDEVAQNWINALNDLNNLYDSGYLPAGTNYASESEIFDLFVNDGAAFWLEGSWRMEEIVRACCSDPEDLSTLDENRLADFTVTFVPAKSARQATDLIGGCTMGYYITRKAWENSDKREAAVSFVEAMTTDAVINRFAGIGAQALKNQPSIKSNAQYNSLQLSGFELVKGSSSWRASVTDYISDDCSNIIINNVTQVAQKRISPEAVVQQCLQVIEQEGQKDLGDVLESETGGME